jgi:DNA-binding beta-propeller fold protein YncE
MMHLTTTTKIAAAAVALSLGWIVLEACDCDETKEDNYPGFWVACVNNQPTLMTYNGNNATVVSTDSAGNFNPNDYDCSGDPSSPIYKGSESSPPFQISGPGGPSPGFRPHATGQAAYNPVPVRSLPFTPDVPPPGATPTCLSSFPDTIRTNHNESNVSRVSTCPFAIKTTIPVSQNPLQIAVTPDGSTALVTSFGSLDGSGGAVTFINLMTNQVTNTVNTLGNFVVTPNGLAISPDGTTAYIGNFTNPGQSIQVMNIATQTITASIPNVVAYPSAMTVTPDGSQLWVGSPLGTETDVIDTLTNTIAFRINIQQAVDIAFNSTGTTAYITSDLNSPGQVFAVNTSTFQIVNTYTVGSGPADIAMSYGDKFLVVNNYNDGTETIIDLVENTQQTIQVGANPKGLAFVQ